MRRTLLLGATVIATACAPASPPPAPPATPAPPPVASAAPGSTASPRPVWPEPFASAMRDRGEPHAQPIPLPRDSRGAERWLVFSGTADVATGAWRVTRSADGETRVEAVERWPTGVRVVGGVVEGGIAYVLLETLAVLDQPAGLHGVWIDSASHASPFDASPLALSDVADVTSLSARVAHPPPPTSPERTAVGLLATLRAAGASTSLLTRGLAAQGADMGVTWQSTFVQHVGKLDGEGAASSPMADRALAIVRAAVATQACGYDACEAWTDSGHAVVRFAVEGGRWVIRAIAEDAPVLRAAPAGAPREVQSSGTTATEAVLRARAGEVTQVLGEAPLGMGGGSIGVGLTDLSHDGPVVAVREGVVARVFPVDAGTVRAEAREATWEVAFADVDGDGRTDVLLRMKGQRADGSPLLWTQSFLAPPASVQATSLEPDLATSLAVMDAPDMHAAALAATSLTRGPIAHDDACRVLTTASTPAGFRRVATPDARVLLFDEPGMPTWRPKVIPLAKIGPDDVRGLGSHCAELVCNPTRPYCAYTAGADSLHAWFVGHDAQVTLAGAADYQGE